jgi:hypothetical protein
MMGIGFLIGGLVDFFENTDKSRSISFIVIGVLFSLPRAFFSPPVFTTPGNSLMPTTLSPPKKDKRFWLKYPLIFEEKVKLIFRNDIMKTFIFYVITMNLQINMKILFMNGLENFKYVYFGNVVMINNKIIFLKRTL